MSDQAREREVPLHPFWRDLDPRYQALIAGCCEPASFAAGEPIFTEGEEARWFYLLRAGRVALEVNVPTRGPLVIQTLESGEVLGWSWLFAPYRWQFSARASEPSRAWAVDGACLRAHCEQDHQLGFELMRRTAQVVVQRLQATRLQLLDIYGHGKQH